MTEGVPIFNVPLFNAILLSNKASMFKTSVPFISPNEIVSESVKLPWILTSSVKAEEVPETVKLPPVIKIP